VARFAPQPCFTSRDSCFSYFGFLADPSLLGESNKANVKLVRYPTTRPLGTGSVPLPFRPRAASNRVNFP
jgi:hypothetical protein